MIRNRKKPEAVKFADVATMPYFPVSVATMEWNTTGSWRYLKPTFVESIPPCQTACPSSCDVEAWIRQLGMGDFQRAWEIFVTEQPFPGITGRVCYHPCQERCSRNELEGAVEINMLERYLADKSGYPSDVAPWLSPSSKRVLVVGGGPAGLSAAYFLARLGHSVVVYEQKGEPGGLLRYGIPAYRLPRDILEKEISKLYGLGVRIECSKAVGRKDWQGLLDEYDAVFVAIGAGKSRQLELEIKERSAVVDALELLASENSGLLKGKRVVVVGGGNSAVDAARSALRWGAKSVTIVYRRTQHEMPAFAEEVAAAQEEGVIIEYLAAPIELIYSSGALKGVRFIRMRLAEADESGRRRPVPVEGSYFTMEADLVVTAIGEVVDVDVLPEWLVLGKDGVESATSCEKLFVGGDMAGFPRTVVDAIASGKKAAIAIDCYFRGGSYTDTLSEISLPGGVSFRDYLELIGAVRGGGEKMRLQQRRTQFDPSRLNTYYFAHAEPSRQVELEMHLRFGRDPFREIKVGVSDDIAVRELERCMHCGRCIGCDNCYIYCPDVAIEKCNGLYRIDYDFCKGCGLCSAECPRGVIEMGEEPFAWEEKD